MGISYCTPSGANAPRVVLMHPCEKSKIPIKYRDAFLDTPKAHTTILCK